MLCCAVVQLDEVHCVSAKEFRLLHCILYVYSTLCIKFVDLLDANLFGVSRNVE